MPLVLAIARVTSAQQSPFLGRWTLTSIGEPPAYVGWLEVTQDAGQLTARFSSRGGSPMPVASIQIVNGELVFQPAAGRRGPAPEHRARDPGGQAARAAPKRAMQSVEFAGARPAHVARRPTPTRPHKFGPPVELFDGKSMDAWDLVNQGSAVVDHRRRDDELARRSQAGPRQQPEIEAEVPGLQDPRRVQTG